MEVINIENLGKKYALGSNVSGSISERLRKISQVFSKKEIDSFWALKDVSFAVNQGEAIGIIGKNGAGKSTLLKILSRITSPTEGKFSIDGRVSSLLEVGTGFHPELSGRENIFLNGTILGMKRTEIRSKFEEIVEFSGVSKFLDTPVKHYSSGMYVRLAFSVAAHLEPEILIIDEVLAVGDAEFQRKCLGKMDDVTKQGRTVLFVSHNITAIRNLCTQCVLIEKGRARKYENLNEGLNAYNQTNILSSKSSIDLSSIDRNAGQNDLVFKYIEFNRSSYFPNSEWSVSLKLESRRPSNFGKLIIGLAIKNLNGENIYHFSNEFLNRTAHFDKDKNYKFIIPKLRLKPGKYSVTLFVRDQNEIQDWLKDLAYFDVEQGNIYDFNRSHEIASMVQNEFDFIME